MKRLKVSNNVIRRLPRYLRKLDELTEIGISRISSFELGHQLGLTPSQIRQDIMSPRCARRSRLFWVWTEASPLSSSVSATSATR